MSLLVLAGASPVASTTIGSGVGATANYYFQSNYAYPSSIERSSRAIPYVVLVLVSAAMNALIFFALTERLSVEVSAAQLATTAVVAAFNTVAFERIFNI